MEDPGEQTRRIPRVPGAPPRTPGAPWQPPADRDASAPPSPPAPPAARPGPRPGPHPEAELPATTVPQAADAERHRVLVALVGFYTGMVLMIAVPSIFVAVVGDISSGRLGTYAPILLLPFAVPVALAIVPRTRRFGRYMLLGMVSTALVVGVVGGGVLWILVSTS